MMKCFLFCLSNVLLWIYKKNVNNHVQTLKIKKNKTQKPTQKNKLFDSSSSRSSSFLNGSSDSSIHQVPSSFAIDQEQGQLRSCPVTNCHFQYEPKRFVVQHMNRHLQAQFMPFKCEICNYCCNSREELKLQNKESHF